MVKDFDYFVDRDHQFTNKIYKTQQKADILWMEQLTSAQGERQVNSFQIKTINQKSATRPRPGPHRPHNFFVVQPTLF